MCQLTEKQMKSLDSTASSSTTTATTTTDESSYENNTNHGDIQEEHSLFRWLFIWDSSFAVGLSPPSRLECCVRGIMIVLTLTALEMLFRVVMLHAFERGWIFQDIFHISDHRNIVARHVAVDAFSCLIVSYMAWQSRHGCLSILRGWWMDLRTSNRDMHKKKHDDHNQTTAKKEGAGDNDGKHSPSFISITGYQQRLFAYDMAGFRITHFFFWYQVKNLCDTILWNDGPEYIMHHVFSMLTAWGGMYPGCGLAEYVKFFFGLSEISTAVLCLLANLDDDQGVPALGDAMPTTKLILGGAFVIFFILCRCILWPIFAYYFARDVLYALKQHSQQQLGTQRYWMQFFLVSLVSLSVLQIAFLAQIVLIGQRELRNMGYLS